MDLKDKYEDVLDLRDIALDILVDAKEAWEKLPKDDRDDVVSSLASVPLTLWTLRNAHKAVKAGDYTKALYYAVLWVGLTNNTNQAALYRRLKSLGKTNRGVSI